MEQNTNWIHFTENDDKTFPGFILKGAGAVDVTNTITQNYSLKETI
jgi:hypothetical protein